MWIMQRRIEKAGLHVENIDYPSRTHSIDELADYLHEQLMARDVSAAGRVHFVTHSMGGIVTRAYIGKYRPRSLGRVVMLSPPNGGSEIVDVLADRWWFRTFVGPAAVELGTAQSSAPNRLGPADFELGVIMGSRSLNPIGSWILSGPDDGSVSVESSKLDGMTDFALVSASHTFIMADRDVAARTLHFLRHGRFADSGTSDGPGDVGKNAAPVDRLYE
jgi:triacylglycerol lipase